MVAFFGCLILLVGAASLLSGELATGLKAVMGGILFLLVGLSMLFANRLPEQFSNWARDLKKEFTRDV